MKANANLAVLYLFRHSHTVEDFTRFAAAFSSLTKPKSCDLVVVLKGQPSAATRKIIDTFVHESGAEYATTILELDDSGIDITAYAKAARMVDHQYILPLNTHSRPEVAGWNEFLFHETQQPGVGLAGATGSYEGGTAKQGFPNPHLRSTAFCLERELFLRLTQGRPVPDREAAIAFESGDVSMTHMVEAEGLAVRVVNGTGQAFAIRECEKAEAFRSVGPQNLLVSDNRTRAYEAADEFERAKLRHFAWGTPRPRKTLRYRLKSFLSKFG